MGPRFSDGTHTYEQGDDGRYHLVDGPAVAPVGVVTKTADPGLAVERALKGAALAKAAREAANAPLDTRKAAADATKAEADARIAAAKAAEAGKDDEKKGKLLTDLNNDSIFRAIQQAQGDIGKGHSAGWWSYLKGLPGTNAQLASSDLGTISSNTMLAKLAELKAQSATGASGMGALSDTEGKILRESISNLDQSLPQDRLLANLRFVEDHYRRAQAIGHGLDPNKVNLNETADKTAVTAMNPDTRGSAALTRTGTQSEVDPTLRAVARHLGTMLANDTPDSQILDYAKQAGVAGDTNLAQALAYRKDPRFSAWQRKNPGVAYPIDQSFYTKDVPLGTVQGLQNTDVGRTIGAYGIGAGQAVTGNRLAAAVGAMGGNRERAQAVEELGRAEHPYAALVGDVAGQVAFEGLGKIAPATRALMATKWGRRGADALYGAYVGSGGDGGQGGAGGGIEGGVTNALGGMAGRATQRGVGNVLTGARDEGLRYLNDKGIPLTLGQMARSGDGVGGKIVAGIEDRLAGYPVVGDFIRSARKRGIEGLDVAAFNEGLQPIGGNIAKHTGAPAVDRVQDLTSQAYSNALDGVNVPHDPQFLADYAAAKAAASKIPVHGAQIVHTLENQVEPYLANGALSGRDLQNAVRTIRGEAAKYDPLPGGTDAAKGLQGVEDSLTGLVGRQAPDVMPALGQANAAYRNQQILQNAVNSSTSGQDQLFTGAQLRRASINNTKNFGGANAAASTDRPFYDLASHADNVLPSSVPDSGSAGRWVLPAAVMGLGSGGGAAAGGENNRGPGAEIGAGLGAALMLPYTKGGQKALQALVMGRRMKEVAAAGQLLKDYTGPGSVVTAAMARDYYLYPDAQPIGPQP